MRFTPPKGVPEGLLDFVRSVTSAFSRAIAYDEPTDVVTIRASDKSVWELRVDAGGNVVTTKVKE